MICTLGSVVFVSILVIRGIWTGVSYVQENRNHTGNELGDDHRAWTGTQPATWSAHHPINTKVSKDERKKKISCMLKENKPSNSWILEGCRQICCGLWELTSFSSIVSDIKCGIHTFISKLGYFNSDICTALKHKNARRCWCCLLDMTKPFFHISTLLYYGGLVWDRFVFFVFVWKRKIIACF